MAAVFCCYLKTELLRKIPLYQSPQVVGRSHCFAVSAGGADGQKVAAVAACKVD